MNQDYADRSRLFMYTGQVPPCCGTDQKLQRKGLVISFIEQNENQISGSKKDLTKQNNMLD